VNAPRVSRRITAAVAVQGLSFLWLLGLSVAMVAGFRTVNPLAEQIQATVQSQQVLALETRVAELAGSVQALETTPAPASATALQDMQQTLQTQIVHLEERLAVFAIAEDVQAMRVEIDDIKARQNATRIAPPAPRRPARPAVIAPQPEPFPYRVLGAERRAGVRSILIAPTGAFSVEQIQVVLPGEALGAWRLQAIEGNAAVFQSGEQIRRVMIPTGSAQ